MATKPAKEVKTRKKGATVASAFTAAEPGATFRCSLDGAGSRPGPSQAAPTAWAFKVKRVKKRS